nr:immunoglobulin light chain junction region [Macaca mulatta]
CQQGNSYPWTF